MDRVVAPHEQPTGGRTGGQARSPLDGVPIAVKDVMATKGLPTTWRHAVVCQSIFEGTPFAGAVQGGVDPSSVEGVADSAICGIRVVPPTVTPAGKAVLNRPLTR